MVKVVKTRKDSVTGKIKGDCKTDWVGAEVVEKTKTTVSDSSESNREGKIVDFALELGFAVAPFYGYGGSLDFYISPNDIIEASYAQASFEFFGAEFFSNLIDVRYKRFWGNSFYTNLGAGQRKLGYSFNFTTNEGSLAESADVASTVINFSIGNKWQFDSFNIGCDWIGVTATLGSDSSVNTTEQPARASAAEIEDYYETVEQLEELGGVTSYQLLRFYLGWAF